MSLLLILPPVVFWQLFLSSWHKEQIVNLFTEPGNYVTVTLISLKTLYLELRKKQPEEQMQHYSLISFYILHLVSLVY